MKFRIIIILLFIGFNIFQTQNLAFAKTLQDLMAENQVDQKYRSELLSYISTHNITDYAAEGGPRQISIAEALDNSGINLNGLPLDKLENLVKTQMANGNVWTIISGISNERLDSSLNTFSDIIKAPN